MSAVLSSVKRPLFWPLYLSEMSVPSDTSNIAVSPTMSMTASIFTLICINIIFYEIFKYKDALRLRRRAGSGAQVFPKMPRAHLLPQAQELTTSSTTGPITCWRSLLKTVRRLVDHVEDVTYRDQREDGRSHAHRG